jgi:dual specificity MAP kinase phosphatase
MALTHLQMKLIDVWNFWASFKPLFRHYIRLTSDLEKGRADGSATLVHCRVGVSRSATICIAQVMATEGLSFPRA